MKKLIDLRGRKPIGKGNFSRVYAFGSRAIKIFDTPKSKGDKLKEFQVQKDLYERGFSVPKPYGVAKVIDDWYVIPMDALIMQRIKGITLGNVEGKLNKEDFYRQAMGEVKRARRLGFTLHDRINYDNFMIDENEKVYLIDFGNDCSSPEILEGVAN